MAEVAQDKKTYRGNCHCGAFVYEATIPEIKELNVCGCSICYKKAYALVFIERKDLNIVKGHIEDFTKYTFGPGALTHTFCSTCGTTVICSYDGMPDQVAISARSIQGPLDVWNMPKKIFPGKDREPLYTPPSFDDLPDPSFELAGPSKVYHGSCHCGDVRVALKIPPIEQYEERVVECNCSFCQRSGATLIYPHRDQVRLALDPDGWKSERLLRYISPKPDAIGVQHFCRRCGVYVGTRLSVETDEEFARLPAGAREFLADKRHWQPLNLRLFHEIDVGDVEVKRLDGWNLIQPPYVNP